MLNIEQIHSHYTAIRSRYAERDGKMQDVLAIRSGRMQDVYPDLFPDDGPFNEPIVANMVDIAARDLSEVTAPLPSFNCSSSTMVSDAARKFAEKRSKIVAGYIEASDLQRQMYTAADRYYSYGFVPVQVEVDFESQMPKIRFLDSIGSYPTIDRFGRVQSLFQRMLKPTQDLMAQYPELAYAIQDRNNPTGVTEIVRYHDKDQDVIFLPGRGNLLLDRSPNLLGECMVRVVQRPSLDDNPRGQFDDVLAIQVAKARFALLSLEAAQKSVQAPIAMPEDVRELALGPDSVLRSQQPEKIRRVPIEIPQGAFSQQALLENEMRQGSRYPEVRGGNLDASIVTGRGVQALMGGFDTQIKTAHSMFARVFTEIVSLCFKVDEQLFARAEKTLRGNENGTPYEIKYRPEKDIKGDYTVDVQYGLMAGLDPNRALIFGLQARGDKLISRDFLRRQLPISFNAVEEEQKVDTEEMRDAMKAAIAGYAQAIPVLAQNGQNPADVLYALSTVIKGRQKGEAIEEVVAQAFAPREVPTTEGVVPGSPGGPQAQPGLTPSAGGENLEGIDAFGNLRGVAPGQIGQGGRPDIQTLLAGLTSAGQPNLQASISRRLPA